MPMAISFATQATVAWTGAADEYVFLSSQFAGEMRLKRGDAWERQGLWSDYPVGVLNELREVGFEPPAFTMEIEGAVPVGAGLSSSASVLFCRASSRARASAWRTRET